MSTSTLSTPDEPATTANEADLLTAEEAMKLTKHRSYRAFSRWAKAHPETKSRHGIYSKRAILLAIRPPKKSRAAWTGSK